VKTASHRAAIISSSETPTPWPCVVEPNFGEFLLDLMGKEIEKSEQPMFAIKKREGFSELVVTKRGLVTKPERNLNAEA